MGGFRGEIADARAQEFHPHPSPPTSTVPSHCLSLYFQRHDDMNVPRRQSVAVAAAPAPAVGIEHAFLGYLPRPLYLTFTIPTILKRMPSHCFDSLHCLPHSCCVPPQILPRIHLYLPHQTIYHAMVRWWKQHHFPDVLLLNDITDIISFLLPDQPFLRLPGGGNSLRRTGGLLRSPITITTFHRYSNGIFQAHHLAIRT